MSLRQVWAVEEKSMASTWNAVGWGHGVTEQDAIDHWERERGKVHGITDTFSQWKSKGWVRLRKYVPEDEFYPQLWDAQDRIKGLEKQLSAATSGVNE